MIYIAIVLLASTILQKIFNDSYQPWKIQWWFRHYIVLSTIIYEYYQPGELPLFHIISLSTISISIISPSHCYQPVVVNYFHYVIPLSNQYDHPLYQQFLSISTILVPVSILIVTISWVITLTWVIFTMCTLFILIINHCIKL